MGRFIAIGSSIPDLYRYPWAVQMRSPSGLQSVEYFEDKAEAEEYLRSSREAAKARNDTQRFTLKPSRGFGGRWFGS